MPERTPVTSIAGLIDQWVGTDFLLLPAGEVGAITRVFLSVQDAPSGGTVVCSVRNAASGGGSGIDVTIADGAVSGSATGSVSLTGAEAVYLRVVSADDNAQWLSGWFETDFGITAGATLTSLSRVKRELKIADADATYDGVLNDQIAAVTKRFQNYTDRCLLPTAYSGEKHGYIQRSEPAALTLREFPLIVPPAVTVTESDVALAAADFEAEEEAGLLFRMTGTTTTFWAQGRRHISVNYTAGFSVVPDDLAQAATAQVADEWLRSRDSSRLGGSRRGLGSVTDGAGNQTTYRSGPWAEGVQSVLDFYRRRA